MKILWQRPDFSRDFYDIGKAVEIVRQTTMVIVAIKCTSSLSHTYLPTYLGRYYSYYLLPTSSAINEVAAICLNCSESKLLFNCRGEDFLLTFACTCLCLCCLSLSS